MVNIFDERRRTVKELEGLETGIDERDPSESVEVDLCNVGLGDVTGIAFGEGEDVMSVLRRLIGEGVVRLFGIGAAG